MKLIPFQSRHTPPHLSSHGADLFHRGKGPGTEGGDRFYFRFFSSRTLASFGTNSPVSDFSYEIRPRPLEILIFSCVKKP
ncbi:hypothetical protein M8J75_004291 [Diaphorina citri]|nr:hypothetical protein M8J75_004291 [Diaphorina citri]